MSSKVLSKKKIRRKFKTVNINQNIRLVNCSAVNFKVSILFLLNLLFVRGCRKNGLRYSVLRTLSWKCWWAAAPCMCCVNGRKWCLCFLHRTFSLSGRFPKFDQFLIHYFIYQRIQWVRSNNSQNRTKYFIQLYFIGILWPVVIHQTNQTKFGKIPNP